MYVIEFLVYHLEPFGRTPNWPRLPKLLEKDKSQQPAADRINNSHV
jgi:hypothetical protein